MATYKLAEGMEHGTWRIEHKERCQVSGVRTRAQLAAGSWQQWRLDTRHQNKEENTYLLVPTGYWLLSLSRLESRSHSNNKTVIINRYYNLSRFSRFAPFSPYSMPYALPVLSLSKDALCPTCPELVEGCPILNLQSVMSMRLAWFLQFEKTTIIGSILKQR